MKTKTLMRVVDDSAEPAYTLARITGWEYMGDINPEHGGYFYKWNDDFSTAEVVQIYSMDDGPSDCVYVISDDIDLPTSQEDIESAMSTCGWECEFDGEGKLIGIQQNGDVLDDPEDLRNSLLDAQFHTWGITIMEHPESIPDAKMWKHLIRRLKNQKTIR